jgi:uncharacterized protein DUF4191
VARADRKSAKAARAAASNAQREKRSQQMSNVKAAFGIARRHDKWLIPALITVPLVIIGGFVVLGIAIGHVIVFPILGVLLAAAATSALFGRRAGAAAFAEVEGKPGASAGVLQSLRGAWRSSPEPVAYTRNFDLVFRAVGRPGVVLVAEGSPARLVQLIAQEKKRVSRVAPDTPIYDVVIGEEKGQVTLRKLRSHLQKLPRNISPAQVRELEHRLRALASGPPMPKGPMPQPGKIPKGMRRSIRG